LSIIATVVLLGALFYHRVSLFLSSLILLAWTAALGVAGLWSITFIARQVIRWLETEHPLKAKILPTEWLGEHSAELVSDAVNSLLDDISH
ncbi:hypothetical protein MJL33_28030, partial [Salmonella enterica subsp. enterica serovar Kentucky]|nr:hypothetical protein [Salmonella enterica subsp. enterica serovar Kentucky]